MTSEEFATALGKLISEALKDGLSDQDVETELELALDLLDVTPADAQPE